MAERIDARGLIEKLCTRFREWSAPVAESGADGPLGWPGYDDQRSLARGRIGADESVICGHARIGAQPVMLIAFEFGFLGGSVGQEAGARIVAAFARARELGLPVVSLVASGGSRIQEGICALRQLQDITRACLLTRQAGLPHITVLRNPTTGGMWASLAAGADLVLASSEAAVAFGGSRVREQDDSEDTAFTAEGKLSAGQADLLVTDAELAEVLATALELLDPARLNPSPEPADVPAALGEGSLPDSGWTAVQRARAATRPRASSYLDNYFATRFPLTGDRAGGTDTGMWCGLGERHGRTIVYAAQTGSATTPAGFRTARRAIRLAGQLGLAVLTLVDTPGAANTAESEREGIGPAIAELFTAVAEATIPITTLVIGEGGSGGALALAAPERTWITPDAYFAVIAPEAGAAILKRGREHVAEVADGLRLRPQDLLDLGFVCGIAAPQR